MHVNCVLILKSHLPSVTCFKIFYKCQNELQSVTDSFENIINDIEDQSTNVGKEQVLLHHLKYHKIHYLPEKAEFLVLWASLLESKIKSRIIEEINKDVTGYFFEFPTLITRSKPHSKFKKNPFYENSIKISTPSLGEFISKCFTYNSSDSIFKMLSDFALVERYETLGDTIRKNDLKNEEIRSFFDRRNNIIHELVDAEEINIPYFIRDDLDAVYEDILSMISRALKVRKITATYIESPEKNDTIKFQLDWLTRISSDLTRTSLPHNYSEWFSENSFAMDELKSKVEKIKKKLEEIQNI